MADPFRAARQFERAALSRKLPPGQVVIVSPGSLVKIPAKGDLEAVMESAKRATTSSELDALMKAVYTGETMAKRSTFTPKNFGSRVDQSVPSPTPTCARCATSVKVEGGLCEVCSQWVLDRQYMAPPSINDNDMIVYGRGVSIPAVKIPAKPPTKQPPRPEQQPTRRRYEWDK